MNDTVIGFVISSLLGVIVWFLVKLINDNDRAHSSFSETVISIKLDLDDLKSRLIKLDVLHPKELKELEKMIRHQTNKIDDIAQKVKLQFENGIKILGDGERNSNYPPDAKDSAFKVEIIERIGRTETQLKTHETAIGRIAQMSKDGAAKTSQIIPAIKELQAVCAEDILAHKKSKGKL